MALEIGSIVEGEVTSITGFGAFVQLPDNKVGLVHISEVSSVYVRDVHDFLQEHQKVKVKVVSVDQRGKIGLSIKQAEVPTAPPAMRPPRPERERGRAAGPRQGGRGTGPLSFEDKVSRVLKDSDDRMLDLRRNTESKRGGRGARRDR